MGGFSRSWLAYLAALAGSAVPLAAQSRTAGRVVRGADRDTMPVAGAPVVLHQVGRASQGPIDSVLADRQGRFAFRFRGDTTAAYLLSVRYHGIQYFSATISSDPVRPDTAVAIVVSDTSSSIPVHADERTLLISRPDETGTRAVVDWLALRNPGDRTRVAPDSQRPSWGAPLPPAAQNVELADAALSQFSREALEFRGDSVLLFAPLSPGRKELVLQYRIPGDSRRFSVPLTEGLDSLFVLLEEPRGRVISPRLTAADPQRIEGRQFLRWRGSPGGAASLEISFPPPPVSTLLILPVLVAAAAMGFALLAVLLLRRRASALPNPLYLADAIARLDAAHADAGGPVSPEAEEGYRLERARLKAELEQALARGGGRS